MKHEGLTPLDTSQLQKVWAWDNRKSKKIAVRFLYKEEGAHYPYYCVGGRLLGVVAFKHCIPRNGIMAREVSEELATICKKLNTGG